MQCDVDFSFLICMWYQKNICEKSLEGHVVTNPYDSISTLSPRRDCWQCIWVTQSSKDTPTHRINMSHTKIPNLRPVCWTRGLNNLREGGGWIKLKNFSFNWLLNLLLNLYVKNIEDEDESYVEAKLHGESKVIQRCFDDNNDDDKRWWQRWWQKAQRSIKEQLKWIKNNSRVQEKNQEEFKTQEESLESRIKIQGSRS